MASKKLKILIVSAEVSPLAKVGGLADVAGALPRALKALGHDVRVVMPYYPLVDQTATSPVVEAISSVEFEVAFGESHRASVFQTLLGEDIPVYLIKSDRYFEESRDSQTVYTLSPEPYLFFDRAVLEFVPKLSPAWAPDVLHCNDWQSALSPVYLKTLYGQHPLWKSVASLLTVHNLGHIGEYDRELLHRAGLPSELFSYDRLEFFGKFSFLKGGLVYADISNTVSKTYAKEIQTPEYGNRLEGLIRFLDQGERFAGIVNGIDTEEFNPATDKRIPANFSSEKLAGKAKCKAALQAECGWKKSKTTPVMGMVTRLATQKGFDLITRAAEEMLKSGVQFVVLGNGESHYEAYLRDLEARYPAQVRAFIDFDPALAQRIYAGSDLFLMPSEFEPCGLGQLIALRYGTIPVVRSTGGLADTITNFNPKTGKGNGFSFTSSEPESLLDAIGRAHTAFTKPEVWNNLVSRALTSEVSWEAPAKEYVKLYNRAIGLHCGRR